MGALTYVGASKDGFSTTQTTLIFFGIEITKQLQPVTITDLIKNQLR